MLVVGFAEISRQRSEDGLDSFMTTVTRNQTAFCRMIILSGLLHQPLIQDGEVALATPNLSQRGCVASRRLAFSVCLSACWRLSVLFAQTHVLLALFACGSIIVGDGVG